MNENADPQSRSNARGRGSRQVWWFYAAAMIAVILPVGFGFIFKYIKLIQTAKTDPDGGFALFPITNYAAITLGFICLLIWAVTNGMFRDIEKPKYTMLEREAELDRQNHRSR
jgi:uncharacterized membrane protein YhaH (DUF805 family)